MALQMLRYRIEFRSDYDRLLLCVPFSTSNHTISDYKYGVFFWFGATLRNFESFQWKHSIYFGWSNKLFCFEISSESGRCSEITIVNYSFLFRFLFFLWMFLCFSCNWCSGKKNLLFVKIRFILCKVVKNSFRKLVYDFNQHCQPNRLFWPEFDILQ